ncbi:MAG: AAA family ATPase [Gaiella sp.]
MPGHAVEDQLGRAASEVVGREPELERLVRFVDMPPAGCAALVIEGEAGIGKTTLWREGVRRLDAAGPVVLRATPGASETGLPLAVLTDLMEPAYRLVRTDLPAPQRHALDVALALERSDGAHESERVLHAATLTALRMLARVAPVSLAIDDAQWVDRESAAALSFALRRLSADPVRCLFAFRLGVDGPFDLRAVGDGVPVERLRVGPLSLGATQRLLLNELGITYPRPVIRRLVNTSGGNPFYALELARGLERVGMSASEEAPVLSQTLDALVTSRISGVSEPARLLLGYLSLLNEAPLGLLDKLDVLPALDEVVGARIVRVEAAGVRFEHPLLAAGARSQLPPEQRRHLHAVLAASVRSPVERARHLAQSTISPSPETASELEAAATRAAETGRPTIGAELARAAARLTPDTDARAVLERRLLEARCLVQAGAEREAADVLDIVIPVLGPSSSRARALTLRARVAVDVEEQRALLSQALEETHDPAVSAEANALLVRNRLYAGHLGEALAAAEAAEGHARRTGEVRRLAAATTTLGLMQIWGTGSADREILERADRLVDSGMDLPSDTYSNPHTLLGARALYRYEVDSARRSYTTAAAAAEAAGELDSVETFRWGLAQLELRAGRYDAAREHVEWLRAEGAEGRRSLGVRWIEGLLATHLGDEETARSSLEETLERAEAGGNVFFVTYARSALGFLELSLGRPASAAAIIEPVLSSAFVLDGEPGQTGIVPIAAEALAQTGALDRASSLVDHLERRGHELEHPWCLSCAARCRGLVLCERREYAAARAAIREALAHHDDVPAPLERARTMLALGTVQLRSGDRRAARASLQEAETAFRSLGAPFWVERVQAELGRIGGRAPSHGALTAHERRIAAMVSEGLTNKEVAAALFVTDRTIESALTQIYRKLGVRSRTELARKLHGV